MKVQVYVLGALLQDPSEVLPRSRTWSLDTLTSHLNRSDAKRSFTKWKVRRALHLLRKRKIVTVQDSEYGINAQEALRYAVGRIRDAKHGALWARVALQAADSIKEQDPIIKFLENNLQVKLTK